MSNHEIRETIRQMLADWNRLTEAQKEAAIKAARGLVVSNSTRRV